MPCYPPRTRAPRSCATEPVSSTRSWRARSQSATENSSQWHRISFPLANMLARKGMGRVTSQSESQEQEILCWRLSRFGVLARGDGGVGVGKVAKYGTARIMQCHQYGHPHTHKSERLFRRVGRSRGIGRSPAASEARRHRDRARDDGEPGVRVDDRHGRGLLSTTVFQVAQLR